MSKMESSSPKLCGACQHFRCATDWGSDVCLKSPKPIDYIGGRKTGYYQAQAERETKSGCGHEGRWWEPK